MRVLGIETSCDETAAAVVEDGLRVCSNVVRTQADTHARFGGVVPEVASREHIAHIMHTVQQAIAPCGGWDAIDGVAVTRAPGLVGALLVGVQYAKGVALARNIPWVGVNHLEGHLSASLLAPSPPSYPHVALVVSGGHTQLYHVRSFGVYEALGGTRDDAAGEAFDKIAKTAGLGYPGGVAIDQCAVRGNPQAIAFPRALKRGQSLEFSFSGLKTAALWHMQQAGGVLKEQALWDFCASVQEAIADVLVHKTLLAAQRVGVRTVVLAGGVAANSRLRALFTERCAFKNIQLFIPPKHLCTDNAAMVAACGWMRLNRGERSGWDTCVASREPLGEVGA